MSRKEKRILIAVLITGVILVSLIPLHAGDLTLYQWDYVLYTIKKSWQEIIIGMVFVLVLGLWRDLLRTLLLFLQKNLFDHLPRRLHKWISAGLLLFVVCIVTVILVKFYDFVKLRGYYYYRLHRKTYEHQVYESIKLKEFLGYKQQALELYRDLEEFSHERKIQQQLNARTNRLEVSLLLANRYYDLYRNSEGPLTLKRSEWLLMARWLNPEDSKIAQDLNNSISDLVEADRQIPIFWEAVQKGDSTTLNAILKEYAWYLTTYNLPLWFENKELATRKVMDQIENLSDSIAFASAVRAYWNWSTIDQSLDYLHALENGELIYKEVNFDGRQYQRYRVLYGNFTTYTIGLGDNLTTIAKKFQVLRSKLIRDNMLDDPDLLNLGDNLLIPTEAFARYQARIERDTFRLQRLIDMPAYEQ